MALIIEFSGTPSSGKNSLIQPLKNIKKMNIEVIEESNIPDEFDFDIRNHELRTLWRIFDTYLRTIKIVKYASVDFQKTLIINRGLFDRIAWSRLLAHENKCYEQVAKDIESNLKRHLHQINFIFLLISPYEKVKMRRIERGLGFDEVFVNLNTIGLLNEIYIELFQEFSSEINIVKIDDTDQDISIKEKTKNIFQYLSIKC